MTTALLSIADGRDDYHDASWASAEACLPIFDHYVHVNDETHTLGFGGAIRQGWQRVLQTDAEYVFHLELDFTFPQRVPVERMISVLNANPWLAQLALFRQPWNEEEKAAGSIVNMIRESLTLQENLLGDAWLEHRRHFTTNPCVYPRWVVERGWLDCEHSEGHFGINLYASNPAIRSAYWGRGEELCTHIGTHRTGNGY